MKLSVKLGFVPAILLSISALAFGQTRGVDEAARNQLIGAWHLVELDAPGADGKIAPVPGLKGSLIYTRDGHVSVQIMYPEADSALTNEYVKNGYEASFGSYDVDGARHTITHHVQGSVTRGLVGKSLTRVFELSGNRLLIRSVDPQEHWRVTWEHD